MGASLAYLKEPNKEIEQESGENKLMKYATGNMQGWRLNMVSPFTQFLLIFLYSYRRTHTFQLLSLWTQIKKHSLVFLTAMAGGK